MKNLVAPFAALLAYAALPGAALAEHAPDGPDPRLGEEVGSICFARSINGWKALRGVDGVVLLERSVNDWYYVEVTPSCRASMFKFANAIGIDTRPAGGCVTRGDAIIVRDTGQFTRRCYVQNIYRWDDRKLTPEELGETPEEAEDTSDDA